MSCRFRDCFLPRNLYPLYAVRLLITLCCLIGYAFADSSLPLALIAKIEQQFGHAASLRVTAWQQLIRSGPALSEVEKLARVNGFFNQMLPFQEDVVLWQQQDYWATPLEFLGKGAGDCEDYAIAKYFTLKAMGVSEDKMRITYVKSLQLQKAHMVLTYFETPHTIPVVLDNLITDILPATARRDLIPVYSFNGIGLWLAKVRGSGQAIGDAGRLSRWMALTQRMLRGGL